MKEWLLKNVLRRRSATPVCGAFIRFRQAPGRGGLAYGEFIFNSADVEEVLITHLAENPHLARDQDGAILRWIQQRDVKSEVPTKVPDSWWRFQYTANRLVESGRCEMYCLQCNTKISKEQFPDAEDQFRGNWVFSTIKCAEGHTLLDVETLHYCVRQ
jgi:hypothetical protein